MSEISPDIQVWFLRHGKPPFNYETDNYDDFMEMLCNGLTTPLAADPEIDFESLPKRVDLIGYSRFTRAHETAELLRKRLIVKQMKEMPSLDEVRFDRDILQPHEFISLKENRNDILERWHSGKNKAESFEQSLARARKIESFLREREQQKIILVTHGWFLRLLQVYFVRRKHTDITLDDIKDSKPLPLGHYIEYSPRSTVPISNKRRPKYRPIDEINGQIVKAVAVQ